MYSISFGPLLRQYAVVITVNLCVLVSGLGIAWSSPVLVKLRNYSETVLSRPMTEEEGSWIISIGFLVGTFPNFLAAYLVDKVGRKYCIILSCLPRMLTGFLFIFATEVWMILIGRAVVGVSDMFVFTIVPMYASEIASKEIRGALVTIFQLSCSMGSLIMFSVGPFISYVNLNIIYTCFMVASTVPLFFLPDSPYFLNSKGDDKKAVQVLTFLRGTQTLAEEELKEYALLVTKETINKKELFKNTTFLKSFAIVLILCAGVQAVGFNSVNYYLQTILESTQTSVRPEIASAVIGLVQLLSSLFNILVTDKFGRRPILTTTLILMTLGMVGLGTFFKLKEMGPITGALNYLPTVSIIFVVIGYCGGIGSTYWVLTAELFDDTSRGVGLCMVNIFSFLILFLTTKYFALLTSVIGPSVTYWIFSLNCILLCVFIAFCVPETKGKTFTEIQVALGAKKHLCEEKAISPSNIIHKKS